MLAGRESDPAAFDFISRWQLAVSLETVWDTLVDFKSWPEWWPGLQSVVETAEGDADGIGQRAVSRWRGPIGYSIEYEIETIDRQYLKCLKGRASGELSGSGTWHITPIADLEVPERIWTMIVFEWNVVATKKWMQLLNPVARPVFVYSHDYVMERGANGMAEYLGCEIRGFATGRLAHTSST
ncbi:MAG TPA: SRPBCC family protein [Solirubrobacterales bacterium]|nr:SRPBCC family protein [Solirubrobacterales bacterium]